MKPVVNLDELDFSRTCGLPVAMRSCAVDYYHGEDR
jgi:hypothetical protein